MVKLSDAPRELRPYLFHGLDLSWEDGNKDAVGDCPFCEKEGKFGVKLESGQYSCYRCKMKGNIDSFIKWLWNQSDESTTEYSKLSEERGILNPETLLHWGAVQSIYADSWMLPGYNVKDSTVGQLYVYKQLGKKKRLLATPGISHKLFGLNLFDPSKDVVYICEGPWDAMVLWEILKETKQTDRGLVPTSNIERSLLADANVVALPGCNVFKESWGDLVAGRDVFILFDNDHPKVHSKTGKEIPPAGLEGTKKLANILSSMPKPPNSISYLKWGDDGYDLQLPSSTDLRDCLTEPSERGLEPRIRAFELVTGELYPIPDEWIKGAKKGSRKKDDGETQEGGIECLMCESYRDLIMAWKKALKWTAGLDHALAAMLASIASTLTVGDPLWLKIIGPAACGKSTLCEAVSVNTKHVLAKSTIRGFHSGYRLDGEDKEQDNSLLAQVKGKTLVTKDGDTLLQSPNLGQILSEARDVYDGTSRTHYRNAMSKDYDDIRMTWLLCGTSSLRSIDSSELGERFLDCVIMEKIDDEMEDAILWRVANRANSNLSLKIQEGTENRYDPQLLGAMQLTGGYIDFLKENTEEILKSIDMPERSLKKCARLGKFVAHMRARPSVHQTENAERELASRLVSQHIRLAKCLALVLNRSSVDEVTMTRVRRISLDTSRGVTYDICSQLYEVGNDGMEIKAIGIRTNTHEAEVKRMLRFLRQIEVTEYFSKSKVRGLQGTPKWRLTERMYDLFTDTHESV